MKKHGLILLSIAVLGGLLTLAVVFALNNGQPGSSFSYDLGSGEVISRSFIFGSNWRTTRKSLNFRIAYEKYVGSSPARGAEQRLGAARQSLFADPWQNHFDKYGEGAGLMEYVGSACLGLQANTSGVPPPLIEDSAKAGLLLTAQREAQRGRQAAKAHHIHLFRVFHRFSSVNKTLDESTLQAEGLLGPGSSPDGNGS